MQLPKSAGDALLAATLNRNIRCMRALLGTFMCRARTTALHKRHVLLCTDCGPILAHYPACWNAHAAAMGLAECVQRLRSGSKRQPARCIAPGCGGQVVLRAVVEGVGGPAGYTYRDVMIDVDGREEDKRKAAGAAAGAGAGSKAAVAAAGTSSATAAGGGRGAGNKAGAGAVSGATLPNAAATAVAPSGKPPRPSAAPAPLGEQQQQAQQAYANRQHTKTAAGADTGTVAGLGVGMGLANSSCSKFCIDTAPKTSSPDRLPPDDALLRPLQRDEYGDENTGTAKTRQQQQQQQQRKSGKGNGAAGTAAGTAGAGGVGKGAGGQQKKVCWYLHGAGGVPAGRPADTGAADVGMGGGAAVSEQRAPTADDFPELSQLLHGVGGAAGPAAGVAAPDQELCAALASLSVSPGDVQAGSEPTVLLLHLPTHVRLPKIKPAAAAATDNRAATTAAADAYFRLHHANLLDGAAGLCKLLPDARAGPRAVAIRYQDWASCYAALTLAHCKHFRPALLSELPNVE